MSAIKIVTNGAYRPLVYRQDVPAKVLAADFDYQDADDVTDGFFKYRGFWYHLDGFMRFDYAGPGNEAFKGWHGISNDSAFSGVLIRISEDGESVMVATYLS